MGRGTSDWAASNNNNIFSILREKIVYAAGALKYYMCTCELDAYVNSHPFPHFVKSVILGLA